MARCAVTEFLDAGDNEHSRSTSTGNDEAALTPSLPGRLSGVPQVCQNFLPRPRITDQLRNHFDEATRFALWARCVLWGQAGSGKRQLATHFATEYGLRIGRKVLWVDDEGAESFIRDYKQAYLQLTGKPVLASTPYGFPLHYLLSHIKRTLEERYDEWFLVILDVNSAIESPSSNAAGLCLADYLPARGQTLITTSSVFRQIIPGSVETEQSWMGLKLLTTLNVGVHALWPAEIEKYYEGICGGSADDLDCIDVETTLGTGFPRLALSLSSMRYANMDIRQYARVMNSYLKEKKIFDGEASLPRGMSRGFPETMLFTWRIATSTSIIASYMLMYISLLGPRHIPWTLLKEAQELKEIDEDELVAVRNRLASLGIFAVHSDRNGTVELNMHHIVHSWIRNMVRDIYSNDEEYKNALLEMVHIVALQFHGEHTDAQRTTFWNMVGHTTSLSRLVMKNRWESSACVTLFSHIALFLFEEGAAVGEAEILISKAIITAKFALNVGEELDFGGHCLASMRETRAKILLFISKPIDAKVELKRAIADTKIFPFDKHQKRSLLRRLRDLDAEIAFRQDDYSRAIKLLELDLSGDTLNGYRKAREHHWMAKCQIASGNLRSALRNSHAALSYWEKQPNKWQDPEMLRWVDWHVTILKFAGKFKSIRVILPGLLDAYISSISSTAEEVWRARCYLGQSQMHVRDHEALIVSALSTTKVEELAGHALTYCLMMLREFAWRLQMRGRLVEAEGIYRHNCDVAYHRKPPDLGDNGPYDYARDRINLVRCMYDQGRREEARALRRLFKTEQGFIDNLTPLIRVHFEDYYSYLDAYRAALQIRRSGESGNLFMGSTSYLKRGLLRFGCLETRLDEDSDPDFDIDSRGIGQARKSKVLHLLAYDFIYLAFFDRKGNTDDLCVAEGQTVIGQYFKFCECRRHRPRSGSLNPVELIEGRFLRQSCLGKMKSSNRFEQTRITKWLRRDRTGSTRKYDGAWLSQKELEDFAKNAAKMSHYEEDCAESGHCASKLIEKTGIPKKSKYWTGTDIVNLDSETGEMTWEPFFLQQGDHEFDSEQIVVPNAADIPVIRVTGADGAPAGPGIDIVTMDQRVQIKITSYFPCLRDDFDRYLPLLRLKKIDEEPDSAL